MFDTNTQARGDRLSTEQAADAGRFDAELSYRNNMLANDDTIAAYRQQKADEFAAKLEAEDAQNKEMYLKLFDLAASGSYSAEDIASIAGAMGLSDARSSGGGSVLSSIYDMANKTQQTIADEKSKADEATNAALAGSLTGAEYSYDLDNLAKQLGKTPEEAKAIAGAAVPNTVSTAIKNGDINGAVSTLENAKANGYIDNDTYQSGYFDIGLAKAKGARDSASLAAVEAELMKMKNSGQITAADCDNLIGYMYRNYGSVLNNVYQPFVYKEAGATWVQVNINGKTYTSQRGNQANAEESETLSKIIGRAYTGAMVGMDKNIFIYTNGEWYKVRNGGASNIYDGFNDHVSTQADVAAPRHTA